jgi:hypothetical protein
MARIEHDEVGRIVVDTREERCNLIILADRGAGLVLDVAGSYRPTSCSRA